MMTAIGIVLTALNWVVNQGGWQAVGLAGVGIYAWRMWAGAKGKVREQEREAIRIEDRRRARAAVAGVDDVADLDDGELAELLMEPGAPANRRAKPVRNPPRQRARPNRQRDRADGPGDTAEDRQVQGRDP